MDSFLSVKIRFLSDSEVNLGIYYNIPHNIFPDFEPTVLLPIVPEGKLGEISIVGVARKHLIIDKI